MLEGAGADRGIRAIAELAEKRGFE